MGKQMIIVVAGFVMIFGIRLHNAGRMGTAAEANLYRGYERMVAENIAGSGIDFALGKLAQAPDWRDGLGSASISGGTLSVTVTDRPDIGPGFVQVRSYGVFQSVTDSVEAVAEVTEISDRFSRFSYFSNTEPVIWFYSKDTLHGPVHTNGRFHMSGTPTFFGLVSSVSGSYDTYGYTDPNFYGGTDFGRDEIDLQPDFSKLQYQAQNGGHLVLNNELYLRFLNDGTYQYKVGSGGSWESATIPVNGVIASNRDIYVEGTLNGQVTVASTDDIYITDDIYYADDPRMNPDSDDLLGLIAYDDVIVQDNAENRNGCTIEGTILARDGSFKAENIDFYPAATLELYGGIVQETRGPVGRLGYYPTGYQKMYRYDERMETMYPPFYPIAYGAIVNLNRKAYIDLLYWVE